MTACRPRYWLVRKIPQDVFRQFSPQFYFGIGVLAFGLAFLRFAIPSGFDPSVMYNALLEDRWSAPWARGALGGWDAFLDHLSYFGYILPVSDRGPGQAFGVVGAPHDHSRRLQRCDYAPACSGRRTTNHRGTARQRRRLLVSDSPATAASGCYLRFAVSSVASVLAMNMMLEIRGTGLEEQMERDQRPLESADTEEEGTVFLHVDDNFLRLTQMNYIFPRLLPCIPFVISRV